MNPHGRVRAHYVPNPQVERAENERVVDDVVNAPHPPVSARAVADLAVFRARRAPVRHAARPNVLVVVARIILLEVAVFAVLGAGFLLLRWSEVI